MVGNIVLFEYYTKCYLGYSGRSGIFHNSSWICGYNINLFPLRHMCGTPVKSEKAISHPQYKMYMALHRMRTGKTAAAGVAGAMVPKRATNCF